MQSTLEPRNVVVNGHRTSVRMEPLMWEALEEIARSEHTTINRLCSMIDRQRRQSTLTAAVRVYAMTWFRTALSTGIGDDRQDEASRLLREAWRPYVEQRSVTRRVDEYEDLTLWSEEVLRLGPSTGLLRLHRVWQELVAARGTIPSVGDLAQHGITAEAKAGTLNLIDVTAEDPSRFLLSRTTEWGTAFLRARVTGLCIGELPFRVHADSVQTQFNRIRHRGRPALFFVNHRFGDQRRSYLRLVVPVSDTADRVTGLISIVRSTNTAPSVYEEPLFRRLRPSLVQMQDNLAAAQENRAPLPN